MAVLCTRKRCRDTAATEPDWTPIIVQDGLKTRLQNGVGEKNSLEPSYWVTRHEKITEVFVLHTYHEWRYVDKSNIAAVGHDFMRM